MPEALDSIPSIEEKWAQLLILALRRWKQESPKYSVIFGCTEREFKASLGSTLEEQKGRTHRQMPIPGHSCVYYPS